MRSTKYPARAGKTEMSMTDADVLTLQQEWYAILKQDGFVDLETLRPSGKISDTLQNSAQKTVRVYTKRQQEQAVLHAAARELLHSGLLRDSDFAVWEQYCEGLSRRKIAKELSMLDSTTRRVLDRCFGLLKSEFGVEYLYRAPRCPAPLREFPTTIRLRKATTCPATPTT